MNDNMLTKAEYNTSLKTKYTSAVTDHSNVISVTLNDKYVLTMILKHISEHEEKKCTRARTHTHTHTQRHSIHDVSNEM